MPTTSLKLEFKVNINILRILIPFLIVALISCKNGERTVSEISVDEVATKELGEKFERTDNGKFSLCFSTEKPGGKWKRVIVINKVNGELIYGPEKLNADVEWFSEDRLRVKEYPEVIKDNFSKSNFTYYYDLSAKKRITETKEN